MNKQIIQALEQTLANRRPTLLDATATYGVLCPLIWRDKQWHLLFEVRAKTLRRQPKEICFPGGRMEPGETPSQTALRETWEELGVDGSNITVLGELDFIAHVSGFLLHPVLGVMEDVAVCPSPAEVDHVFMAPLSFFQTTEPVWAVYGLEAQVPEEFPYDLLQIPKPYPFRPGSVESPVWVYEGHAIWGLTARVVQQIAKLLPESEKSEVSLDF